VSSPGDDAAVTVAVGALEDAASEPGSRVGPAEFVRVLMERGELARVRSPLKRVRTKGVTPPRISFMAESTKKGTLRWLVRSGGWRVRQVVTAKRRREGRIWATGIWEALDLRFSAATLELLAAAAAASQGPAPFLPKTDWLGALVPATLGDLIVFHIVLDALLEATPTPPEAKPPAPEPKAATPVPPGTRTRPASGGVRREASPPATPPPPAPAPDPTRAVHMERRRALLAISPLTALFRADEIFPVEKLGTQEGWTLAVAQATKLFTPLLAGDRALLLTYLDDALAIRWVEHDAQRRALPPGEAASRYLAFAAALEGFAAAARTAQRPDALRPLLRFFERYLVRFGQRESVARSFQQHSLAIPRVSDRARFLATVARVFAVSQVVASESERALSLPFVDRTEEEKVFVADVSEFTRSVLPELEAIRRELAGEVG
jgi:hypothetical protein